MLKAENIIARIRAGDELHMQFTDGRRVWWFEQPHQVIPDKLAMKLLSASDSPIVEAGDSLFGLPLNSQTFLSNEEAVGDA
ncbi:MULTISPECIES: hypothetical protein [unclassified Rhizobium]|uniref:hypothetical protein n=1 Tax=unclassified Rhizobium TaxID=2613769 RepID=UPI00160EF57C|nr:MULTISPECIES: hypothetical protein [unclassified Rhizobium]MBB3297842.1 hypothetical protein [Rhizobium sp. BK112]MBB4177663.1 hypothetical protein [Rhizobium sp. BK109]